MMAAAGGMRATPVAVKEKVRVEEVTAAAMVAAAKVAAAKAAAARAAVAKVVAARARVRVRAVVVSGVKAKAAVMVVVTREAAGRVAGRVAAAAAETAAATAEMATVRYRERMAAGAGTVTVRRSTGLTERRAGTYSPEDDGEATVLPIERVRTSLRTG